MIAPFVAAVLEGAVAALAGLFAFATAPIVFRSLPPEHAGRVFGALARRQLAAATALAAGAFAGYLVAGDALPAILSGAVCALLFLAPLAIRRFERARVAALADVAPGAPVPAAAVIASHGRLRTLRIAVGAIGLLAALNVGQTAELLLRQP